MSEYPPALDQVIRSKLLASRTAKSGGLLLLSLSLAFAAHADLPVTTGLVAHLDASNVNGLGGASPLDDAAVATWTNLVGSGNNSLSVGGNAPTFKTDQINGLPTIRFNGTDNVLRFETLNQNQLIDSTIFIVSNADSSQQGFALSSDSGSGMRNSITTGTFASSNGWAFAQKVAAPQAIFNSQFAVSGGRSIDLNQFRVVGTRFADLGEFDTGAVQELFLAGDSFSSELTTPDLKISQNSQSVQLGARNSGASLSNFFKGDISEVLIYDRAITDAERQQVELYLGQKYNTSISPGLKLHYSYDNDDLTDRGSGRAGSLNANGSTTGTFVAGPSGENGDRAIQLQQDAASNGSRIQSADISDEINFNTDDWTISTWAMREDDGTRDQDFIFHVGRGDGFGGEDELYLFWNTNNNSVQLQHYNNGESGLDVDLTLGTVVPDEWAHFLVLREGDELRAYLNGEEVASDLDFLLGMDQSGSSRLTIGGVNSNNFARSFDGFLDETAVWNRALTDLEIDGLANGGTSPLFSVVPEPSSTAISFALLSLFASLKRRRRN